MGGKGLDPMWADYLSMQSCRVCVLGDGGVECEDNSESLPNSLNRVLVVRQKTSLSILRNPLTKNSS